MKLLRFLPILILVVLSSCLKNEITMTFNLPQNVTSTCKIMYYMSGKNIGEFHEVMAEIREGHGEIKLPERYPAIIYLFSPNQRKPAAVIYGERGDKFTVEGKGSDVAMWEISGNQPTSELSSWRIKNAAALNGPESDKIDKLVADYVTKHPDSQAAAILLYVYFDRRNNEKQFLELQAKLNKKVLEDKDLMRALSAADMLGEMPEKGPFPDRIVLNGSEGYADTLSLRSGKPVMLLFRSSRGSDVINTDSLKKFVASYGGGSIAELYAESDSTAWQRHITNDSISGLRRLWLPLGLQDSISMQMGVKRIPYIIVVDGDNKEVYHGDKWSEATSIFKSLSK